MKHWVLVQIGRSKRELLSRVVGPQYPRIAVQSVPDHLCSQPTTRWELGDYQLLHLVSVIWVRSLSEFMRAVRVPWAGQRHDYGQCRIPRQRRASVVYRIPVVVQPRYAPAAQDWGWAMVKSSGCPDASMKRNVPDAAWPAVPLNRMNCVAPPRVHDMGEKRLRRGRRSRFV